MKPVRGLENYHLLEQIGEGSFGKVYRGRRKNTLLTVAIKTISKHGKSQRDLTAIWQEIRILADLSHENIIRWIDAIDTPDNFIVVMEFAQGELYEILTYDKCLPEDVVQNIARQLVKALYYLHSHRILHRDMKPQNILISSNGVVKLCDFGFARCMSSATMVLTSIKGTPLYMAPELVQERPYNHTVDLWSLGIILFELYVGKPPFFTKALLPLFTKIVNHPVAFPESMSPAFKNFLQGLLCKQPGQRLSWPQLLDHEFIREASTSALSPTSVAVPRSMAPNRTSDRGGSLQQAASTPPQPPDSTKKNPTPADTPATVPAAKQLRSHPVTSSLPTASLHVETPPVQQEQRVGIPLLPSPAARSPQNRPPLVETQAPSPNAYSQSPAFKKADTAGLPRGQPVCNGQTVPAAKPTSSHVSSSVAAILQQAEASKPGTRAGAQQLWIDGHTVAALSAILQPPADKLSHARWATAPTTCSAVKVTVDLLRHSQSQAGSVALQQTLAIALIAAAPVAPANVSSALDMLRLTDAATTSRSGGAVALEESASLYTALVGKGHRRGSEAWRVVTAAADGLGALLSRAHHLSADRRSTETQKAQADLALSGPWFPDAIKGLVVCIAAAAGVSSAASCAAMAALAAAVHTAAGGSCASSSAEHFPLTAALGACTLPAGLSSKMLAARIATASALAECRGALPALKAHLGPARAYSTNTVDSQCPGNAVAVLLASCCHSPACCKAAANADLPQALVAAAHGRHGVEAMLALAAMARGVQGPTGAKPLARLFSTADELAKAIGSLLPIVQATQDDPAAASAAAGALGGIVAAYNHRWTADSQSPAHRNGRLPLPRPEPPPRDLFSSPTMAALRVLLVPRVGKSPVFAAFEGVGCQAGTADGPLALAAALVAAGGPAAPAGQAIIRENVAHLAVDLMAGAATMPPASSLAELSPNGLLSLLSLTSALASPDGLGRSLLARNQVMAGILAAVSPAHLKALRSWGSRGSSDDSHEVAAVAAAVTHLLSAPFAGRPAMPETDTSQYVEDLAGHPTVAALTRMLPFLGSQDMVPPVSLIARLLLSEKPLARRFAAQYISADGLAPGLLERLLGSQPSQQAVTVQTLQIVSQLARVDPGNYEALDRASVCSKLLPLLSSGHASVRSRVANLMGNLARHSSFFYGSFQRAGLVPLLVELCGDPDPEVRKFACFAIGNAAFHSSELYGGLAPAVAPLVAILSSEADTKARANAAGALGNLVRKSERLVPTLLAAGALQALLKVLSQPATEATGSSCKIAVFSLVNLAQWHACDAALRSAEVVSLLHHVVRTTQDASAREVAHKMLDELGSGSTTGLHAGQRNTVQH